MNDLLVNASESVLLEVNSDVPGGVQLSLVEALEFITTDVSGPRCSVRIGADAALGWLAKLWNYNVLILLPNSSTLGLLQ